LWGKSVGRGKSIGEGGLYFLMKGGKRGVKPEGEGCTTGEGVNLNLGDEEGEKIVTKRGSPFASCEKVSFFFENVLPDLFLI